MIKKIIKVSNSTMDDMEIGFNNTDFLSPIDLSSNFGSWLNLYFEPWNPDDDTWIDSNKHCYTTDELLTEFIKTYDKRQINKNKEE